MILDMGSKNKKHLRSRGHNTPLSYHTDWRSMGLAQYNSLEVALILPRLAFKGKKTFKVLLD